MSLPTLSQLLSPFPIDAFIRQFDSKAPVVLRPVLSTPLDLERLDRFVAERGLRWPTLHLEDAHGPVPPDRYTRVVQWGTGLEPHLIEPDAVRAGLQRGERVVLPELHRHHGPTGHLVRAYEVSLGMRGGATAVLAPSDAPARALPAQGVHRYLLQCHGTRLCSVATPDGTTEDFELVVGCVMYVPPGHTVSTQPLGGPSLAVDLMLRPIRVRDVAVAELRAFPRDLLRHPAPVGLGQDPSLLVSHWADLVERLLDEADHEAVLESLVDRFVQSRLPLLRGQLGAADAPLYPHTKLRRRAAVMYRVVDTGSAVELRFHGKTIPFPREAEELVKYMATAEAWTPADLDGVPTAHQQAIAERLVAEGFCERV